MADSEYPNETARNESVFVFIDGKGLLALSLVHVSTVEPRYLELAYFELPLISK